MSEVVVTVNRTDEAPGDAEPNQLLEAAVDADIVAFGEYFQRELKNDEPLSKSERAIIKTYLWWKTHPEKHDAEQASSSEHV